MISIYFSVLTQDVKLWVLIPLFQYKPHDTSFLDQINMMSTVFGMKHTYSVKI